ncbi:MAG: MFS transporter [Anaerolineae bacterium]
MLKDPQATSEPSDAYQQRIAHNYLWNFCASTVDGGVFSFVMSLLSPVVVLPYYAGFLSRSALVPGAVYTFYALGRTMPQVVAANMTKHLARKKPFMVWMALLERAGIALIFVTTLLLPAEDTRGILTVFLMGYALLTLSLGFMSPAWLDFLAKAIYKRRGTFFGVLNATGGFLSILGSLAFTAMARRYPFPQSFTIAFGLALAVSSVSLAALAAYREVPSPFTAARTSLREHLESLPDLLERDRNFRFFALSRAAIGAADIAVPFYAIYALHHTQGSTLEVATLNLTLMVCQAVSTLLWGYLGDRRGYRLIYRLATATGFATAGLALVVSGLAGYMLVFLLLGITLGGLTIADSNLVLELSPRDQTPTYVGLMNLILGPVMGLAPLVGGLLASAWGYPALFVIAMFAQAIGWAGMTTLVRDPREIPRTSAPLTQVVPPPPGSSSRAP